MTTVEKEAYRLMDIYSAVVDRVGYPYGNPSMSVEEHKALATKVITETIAALSDSVNFQSFDQRVRDILEDENFHTLCTAIDIARGKQQLDDILYRYCI